MTVPKGGGIHRRMVYVEPEEGASLEEETKAAGEAPCFAGDETYVIQVAGGAFSVK